MKLARVGALAAAAVIAFSACSTTPPAASPGASGGTATQPEVCKNKKGTSTNEIHIYSSLPRQGSNTAQTNALVESDEVGHETIVSAGSQADGKSIKDLSIETETGMFVLAVQRGRRWTYRPKARFVLAAGDRIIAIGPAEGGEELDKLVGMERELAEA